MDSGSHPLSRPDKEALWQRLRYLTPSLNNLTQTGHTPECPRNAQEDLPICTCGYSEAVSGVSRLIKHTEGKLGL